MTGPEMFLMWIGILLGFICIVVAAGGYRMGWSRKVWIGWIVAALFFLTVIPVATALTLGLSPGVGGDPFHTGGQ